jgi:hypothetical protein
MLQSRNIVLLTVSILDVTLLSLLILCKLLLPAVRGLSKKYPTLFFPKKTVGRLANLTTVVGGNFMRMYNFLQPRLVHLSLLGS